MHSRRFFGHPAVAAANCHIGHDGLHYTMQLFMQPGLVLLLPPTTLRLIYTTVCNPQQPPAALTTLKTIL
jgi:hypothetical protein